MNIIKKALEDPAKCLGPKAISFVPAQNTIRVIQNEFNCTRSSALEKYQKLRALHLKALKGHVG